MSRDYVGWYKLKTQIDKQEFLGNFSEREVWWVNLGANIGDEEDGKNKLFERPVLIVRKYSRHLFWALPLSTVQKKSRFYHPISIGAADRNSVVLLSQGRVISSKRLQRRLGRVTSDEHSSILSAYAGLHEIKSDPQQAEGLRAPNGDLYTNNIKHEHESQEKSENRGGK